MKKFLVNIVIFSLLLIGINILGYFFLSKNVIFKDYIIPVRELKSYNSLLLGDSHSNAIRQSDLEKPGIANFSFDGDSYFDILAKLDYLIPGYRPDTIYLCVDDHTLSKYREYWMNRDRSIYYAPFSLYRDYYNYSKVWFLYKKYGQLYLPFFNTKNSKLFGAYIKSRIHPVIEHDYTDFSFASLPEQNRIDRSVDRVETQFPSGESSGLLTRCLNEIIDDCMENGITLIGVKFPLTGEYLDALGSRSYHADTILEARGIPVWDFRSSLVNRDSLFRDQDHVNNTGSEIFVGLLEKKIAANPNPGSTF